MKALIPILVSVVSIMVFFGVDAQASVYDLQDETSSATININGAFFGRTQSTGSGTGNFSPFLQVGKPGQGELTAIGYNTDGTPEFDTKGQISGWTHSIMLSQIPIVNSNNVSCYEFILDAAEQGGNKNTLYVNKLELYLQTSSILDSYPSDFTNLRYSLGSSNSILLNNINNGQGGVDLFAYVPTSLFSGPTSNYLYLYTELGYAGGAFEEWGAKEVTASSTVPEPVTVSLLGLGLFGLLGFKRKNR